MTQTVNAVAPQVVELEPRRAAAVRIAAPAAQLPTLLPKAFEETMAQIAASGAQLAGPPFARYLGFGVEVEADVGFPYTGTLERSERVRDVRLPGGRAVLATHVGAYDEIASAWAAIKAWIDERELEPTSAPWESYLTGPDDPGLPVTQIVFPIG